MHEDLSWSEELTTVPDCSKVLTKTVGRLQQECGEAQRKYEALKAVKTTNVNNSFYKKATQARLIQELVDIVQTLATEQLSAVKAVTEELSASAATGSSMDTGTSGSSATTASPGHDSGGPSEEPSFPEARTINRSFERGQERHSQQEITIRDDPPEQHQNQHLEIQHEKPAGRDMMIREVAPSQEEEQEQEQDQEEIEMQVESGGEVIYYLEVAAEAEHGIISESSANQQANPTRWKIVPCVHDNGTEVRQEWRRVVRTPSPQSGRSASSTPRRPRSKS
jgi:hypothetical protein